MPPWHGVCGTPGSAADPCHVWDEGHMAPDTCATAVQVGSGCWLCESANYGLYGVLMRTCHDWLSPLVLVNPGFSLAAEMFDLPSTMAIVYVYKSWYRGKDATAPAAWASATWQGGPTAYPPGGGDRPACATTCTGPPPPPFIAIWGPHLGTHSDPELTSAPPYGPGCTPCAGP